MVGLKKKKTELSASTVLEVIVASILFLGLFFLAMEMLVRISGRQADDTLLQVEIDRQACIHEFTTGNHAPGEYIREYGWGEMTVAINQYREIRTLQEVFFTTRIARGNRTFLFRTLKKVGYEKE